MCSQSDVTYPDFVRFGQISCEMSQKSKCLQTYGHHCSFSRAESQKRIKYRPMRIMDFQLSMALRIYEIELYFRNINIWRHFECTLSFSYVSGAPIQESESLFSKSSSSGKRSRNINGDCLIREIEPDRFFKVTNES